MLAGDAHASDSHPERTQDLKRLSIEELMQLDVTSVSRRPERIVETPAAVSVITAEDIRRAGVSTLPDALRLADASSSILRIATSIRGMRSRRTKSLIVQRGCF